MGHYVLEFVHESVFHKFRGLEIHLVLQRGVITEGELLIELLLTYTILSLERVKSLYRECDVRQSEGV